MHNMHNMQKYGIKSTALSWFSSYFSSRKQHVKIGCFTSNDVQMDSGCPQGSVIGPIGYNLYTAPLAHILDGHGVRYHKYADDLQVYLDSTVDNIPEAKAKLEQCLAHVRQWMLRWHLKINDEKTEFLLFRNRQTTIPTGITLRLGDNIISLSSDVRNLGVILDPHLSRENHVSLVVRSCNFALFRLGRIRQYITQSACKKAVHALVLIRLDYCNSLLVDLPAALLHKLQRLQNRAARIVLLPRADRNVIIHATPLLQELSWLPIKLRIMFKVCCLVHKCQHSRAPLYLCELIQAQVRPGSLRQPRNNDLFIPRTSRRIGSTSFAVAAPTMWNQLPIHLKQENELFRFRKNLKTFLWQTYLQT